MNPVIPKHVAIIMDGNGRWAQSRNLSRSAGHKEGVSATRCSVEYCAKKGVQILTVFAFSSENWNRPKTEVMTLMELFVSSLKKEAPKLAENNITLKIIGDKKAFSRRLQQTMLKAEQATVGTDGMTLQVAANYGGRWDITNACREIASIVKAGDIQPEDITEELLSSHLKTGMDTDPDLLIRTGGEYRISNFLLWQLAYAELYFTDTLWPDVDEKVLEHAFASFATRNRRFGEVR